MLQMSHSESVIMCTTMVRYLFTRNLQLDIQNERMSGCFLDIFYVANSKQYVKAVVVSYEYLNVFFFTL